RNQKQVRDGGRGIGPLVVLRDSHGPQDANTFRRCNLVRQVSKSFDRQASDPRSGFEGEELEAFLVLLEPTDPLIQELLVGLAGVEQIAADRVQPDQICTRLGVNEEIGTLSHLILAQVRHNQLLTIQFVGALYTGRNHRVALGRVAADNQYQVRLLNIRNRTRVASIAYGA